LRTVKTVENGISGGIDAFFPEKVFPDLIFAGKDV